MSIHFWENLKSQQYPSHVINFRKQELSNIKVINSSRVSIRQVNLNSSSSYFSKLEILGKP